ncbi:hypothetical protein EDB81DRAFT_806670 [Dactylonectria macrodidyma]|uniref:Uncharacterized protein n=1 Tax=Dactylonectria macrodidyma TaxID=307937 RepID=A0A9P9E960_9HYPO|nr:hypothetical protein EDB81DRAFT_806670 [Dactylonectria macrodidyma]
MSRQTKRYEHRLFIPSYHNQMSSVLQSFVDPGELVGGNDAYGRSQNKKPPQNRPKPHVSPESGILSQMKFDEINPSSSAITIPSHQPGSSQHHQSARFSHDEIPLTSSRLPTQLRDASCHRHYRNRESLTSSHHTSTPPMPFQRRGITKSSSSSAKSQRVTAQVCDVRVGSSHRCHIKIVCQSGSIRITLR